MTSDSYRSDDSSHSSPDVPAENAAKDVRLPPLKTDPRYGHYPWWPEDGDAWLHPEDVQLARRTIPSPRIWRRDGKQGVFAILSYGADRLRVKPRLWQETPAPAFEMGDLVEVLPHGMQNDPVTGRICQVHWDDHTRTIYYQLACYQQSSVDRVIETRYTANDLKLVEPTKPEPMPRIDPSPADQNADAEVDQMLEGLEPDRHRRREG
ncbi:MAG: hypothetical protein AAGF31_05820 [Planctomycetota bacterium]